MSVVNLPLVEELTPAPDIPAALRAFRLWPNLLLLDSSRTGIPTGRYSFLAADPFHFDVLQQAEFAGYGNDASVAPNSRDPLLIIQRQLQAFHAAQVPGLPPFQG